MRRSVLSTPPVAYKGIAISCKRNSLNKSAKSPLMISIGDLAIGCLGVHAIESLDVRVATKFVKMMKRKKVERNKSSNFDSSILILLAVLRRMVFASSSFLSKSCEIFRCGNEIFPCFHWSSLTILIIACQRDGAFVPVPLMPGCGVRDVDRRVVVQVSAILFRPSMNFLRFSIHFVILPSEHDGSVFVLSCSSFGIHCFPTVLLPLSFAMLLAP